MQEDRMIRIKSEGFSKRPAVFLPDGKELHGVKSIELRCDARTAHRCWEATIELYVGEVDVEAVLNEPA